MRISLATTATTIVCSTLSAFAFYQAFAELFLSPSPHSSDSDADPTEANQPTKPASKVAIATPEKVGGPTTAKSAQAKPGQKQNAASGATARSLPSVTVPDRLTSTATIAEAQSSRMPESASSRTVATSAAESSETSQDTSPPPMAPPLGTPMGDINGHWAQSYIESLATKGVIRGYIDGNFHPDDPVTAAQFATMTQKAFEISPISYNDLRRQSRNRVPTRAEAAAFIYQAMAKVQQAPITTAVQISGEVQRPGIYALPAGKPDATIAATSSPTVMQAIQRAGGVLSNADLQQVQIHRVGETGVRQVINVNVRRMLQTGDRAGDIALQQGDRLYIPTASTAQTVPDVAPTPGAVSLVGGRKQ